MYEYIHYFLHDQSRAGRSVPIKVRSRHAVWEGSSKKFECARIIKNWK